MGIKPESQDSASRAATLLPLVLYTFICAREMPVWERKHLKIGSGCATAVAGACWCSCFDKVCAAQTHCQRLVA